MDVFFFFIGMDAFLHVTYSTPTKMQIFDLELEPSAIVV